VIEEVSQPVSTDSTGRDTPTETELAAMVEGFIPEGIRKRGMRVSGVERKGRGHFVRLELAGLILGFNVEEEDVVHQRGRSENGPLWTTVVNNAVELCGWVAQKQDAGE
jgi:hypothetical protein